MYILYVHTYVLHDTKEGLDFKFSSFCAFSSFVLVDLKLPKVALTPQRKTFEGGCSWRNKGGSKQQEEGENDSSAPSSALLREEEMFGFVGEHEQEYDRFSEGYEYTKGRYGRGPQSQLPYNKRGAGGSSGGGGGEKVAKGPKKIDHIPLKDQESAGWRTDYGKDDSDRSTSTYSRHVSDG